MTESSLHSTLVWAFMALALCTFPVLLFVAAPYGRYTHRRWGPTLDRRVGWIAMEAPAPLVFAACFAIGARRASPVALAFLALWLAHYLHRAFVFPFRMRGAGARTTLVTVALGAIFNLANGYLNGRCLTHLAPPRALDWLWDPRFVAGALLFAAGLAANLHSDTLLIRLREPGETDYKIPRGGLFELVSCPNYLGEIVEWSGWALATWSLPGLAFALWTAANLGPRARTHHAWYRSRFPDYPSRRRALIPFLL
jgi:protein-S-isoprenylcysteine O-methyltransferase Ste14